MPRRCLVWTFVCFCLFFMGESLPGGSGGARHRPVRTLRVKMVLLGSSGVGKSSLALRFSRDQFKNSSPTVGCAYLTRTLHLSDVTFRLEIWDTAGQEKYHSVTPLYYRGAHAALVVYDISQRTTFIRAQVWIRELQKQYIPGSTVMCLVGNKTDLDQDRQVPSQEGQNVAEENGLMFTETSALSGDQVNELLLAVAHRVYECVGGKEEVLSEWQETLPVHRVHRNHYSPLASCCRLGP